MANGTAIRTHTMRGRVRCAGGAGMASDDKSVKKEEKADAEAAEEGEQPETPPAKGRAVRLLLLMGAPVVLLIAGGAGAYFLGALDGLLGAPLQPGANEQAEISPKEATYYDLPEMLVNLNGNGRRANYLRVVLSLEVAKKEDLERIEQVKPRIIDNFQAFLRELRVEDLRGSAGMYRLKEELLARVNEAARPAAVKDVLFREMLVQ